VIGELTALGLSPDASVRDDDRWAKMGRFYQELATNPLLRRVQHLNLSYYTYHTAVEPLTAAETFDSVERFRVGWQWADSKPVARFMEAPWVQRLRYIDIALSGAAAGVTAAALGRLPHLHTLETKDAAAPVAAVLAGGRFHALERLICRGTLGVEHARALAEAKFPALVAFEAIGTGTKNDAFCELLKADWFGRLRTLSFEESPLGDRALKALAAHPVAKTLRSLTIGEHALTPDGLMALARAFPALTTLNLWLTFKRRGTPPAVTKFVKVLDAPNLRHLDLNGWQLGDDGAKALARNRSLTKLTRLSLESCRIGDAGAKALIAAPHLQNLVELKLGANPIRHGADALGDPAVMPQLGELWLYFRALSKKTAKKLESRSGLYVIL
jgi:Leucine Rich repeat